VHILLCELHYRGLRYKVAAQNKNLEAALPSSSLNLIRLTDRDVILVRERSEVKIIKKVESNFKTNLLVQIAGQPFTILRGWSAIDASVQGCVFRVVNTHLDPDSSEVQIAQANELLLGPGETKIPLIFTGDFNSNANGSGTPTYGNLIAAGFEDTWISANKGKGFTCCQDANLLNAKSRLNERIDLILFKHKKNWTAVEAEVVGDTQCYRTKTRLWPSDHAGVNAKLELKKC
jgi:endonuclease/exonuclease/phosphatase family metal-dependent hydrolase